MRILLICSAFNSLTQRVFVELDDIGHEVGCSVAADGDEMGAAVDAFDPELVIAPYLKTAIPEDVWGRLTCLIVHPGVRGDRGASSLDWAILRGLPTWGVTVLQAAAEFDAGDIWAYREFALGDEPKSAVCRHRVADAAVHAVLEAIVRFDSGTYVPEPLDYGRPEIEGRLERPMKQADRAIDWSASTADVLRRLRCSDSTPGVLDTILNQEYLLFGAHEEEQLRGRPGTILAQGRRDRRMAGGQARGAPPTRGDPSPQQLSLRRAHADAARLRGPAVPIRAERVRPQDAAATVHASLGGRRAHSRHERLHPPRGGVTDACHPRSEPFGGRLTETKVTEVPPMFSTAVNTLEETGGLHRAARASFR